MKHRIFFLTALLILLLCLSAAADTGITPVSEYISKDTDELPDVLNIGVPLQCGDLQIMLMGQPVLTKSNLGMIAELDMNYLTIRLGFTNTSDKDFYGVDGIVPVGGKFYLVGQLTASAATETESKVFKQDYTTTARVAIKDLRSAYNTIPDLKAPQLEIGLSIDLSWETGHTYDLEL